MSAHMTPHAGVGVPDLCGRPPCEQSESWDAAAASSSCSATSSSPCTPGSYAPQHGHRQQGNGAEAVVRGRDVGHLHRRLSAAGGQERGGEAGQGGALDNRLLRACRPLVGVRALAWAAARTLQA